MFLMIVLFCCPSDFVQTVVIVESAVMASVQFDWKSCYYWCMLFPCE